MTLTGIETKADLLKICETNGIDANSKTTNKTMIDLIKADGDYQENPNEGIPKLSDIPIDEIPGQVIDDAGQILIKTTSKLEDIVDDNERMVEISVTDHDNSQSIEDDLENRLFQASWGNLVCTPRRESVLVNGTSQMASRGMIKHMRTLTVPSFTKDAQGNVKTSMKPRFTIHELEGWTPEQLAALKQTQAGRLINH